MATTTKRIEQLEAAIHQVDKPHLVAYWEEGKGYWLTHEPGSREASPGSPPAGIDYRACLGGAGAIPITEDRLRQLKQDYTIFLVRWEDWGKDGND